MTRYLLILLTAFFTCSAVSSQTRYTQRVQQPVAGKGTLTLHQDQTISDLVDGVLTTSGFKRNPATDHVRQDNDTITVVSPMMGTHKIRVNGYRVQVYSGGNSREAKIRAEQMGQKVKRYYPEHATYIQFKTPRWICHMGDFITREEAMEVLQELRKKGGFNDAIVVKSKVNVYVN